MPRPGKLWRVGPRGKEEPDLLAVLGIVIVVIDALSDFGGSDANDGIRVRVIVGRSLENLDSENPLLQLARLSFQGTSHYEPEKLAVPFTRVK
jgi:hypothetical protein